jgi:phytanoyl-CoA hydroxylase
MSAQTPLTFSEEVPVDPHAPGLYHYAATPRALARLEELQEEHLAFFHEQGYLVVEQVFTPAQVQAACAGIFDLIDGRNPAFRGVQLEAGGRSEEKHLAVRKLMHFVDYDPRLKDMAQHPGLLSLLERLLGDRPVLFQDMALLKPPGGREKPWHQDCAYFNIPLGTLVIGVWIALDQATAENGCLHILPGTHREGPVNHFKRRDWQICDTQVQTHRDVMVPLEPGGCLLWHGLLHHGSPTNKSGKTRRALQFHYKPQGAGEIATEERLQHFGGEVRGAQC